MDTDDKLAYFGLSILWRSGVHMWNTAFGEKSNRMDLEDFEEPIRLFLHGDGPFPADVAVQVTVSLGSEFPALLLLCLSG